MCACTGTHCCCHKDDGHGEEEKDLCEAKKVAAAQRMTFWKCVLELTSLAGELDGSICSSMLLPAA